MSSCARACAHLDARACPLCLPSSLFPAVSRSGRRTAPCSPPTWQGKRKSSSSRRPNTRLGAGTPRPRTPPSSMQVGAMLRECCAQHARRLGAPRTKPQACVPLCVAHARAARLYGRLPPGLTSRACTCARACARVRGGVGDAIRRQTQSRIGAKRPAPRCPARARGTSCGKTMGRQMIDTSPTPSASFRCPPPPPPPLPPPPPPPPPLRHQRGPSFPLAQARPQPRPRGARARRRAAKTSLLWMVRRWIARARWAARRHVERSNVREMGVAEGAAARPTCPTCPTCPTWRPRYARARGYRARRRRSKASVKVAEGAAVSGETAVVECMVGVEARAVAGEGETPCVLMCACLRCARPRRWLLPRWLPLSEQRGMRKVRVVRGRGAEMVPRGVWEGGD